jgi:CopG family transcriptional regulator, nickel-responsive regulator
MARTVRRENPPANGKAPAHKRNDEYVVRLSVSLEPDLLALLDSWVRERNSPSRSEALRALIRKELAEHELGDPNSDSVASVLLIYRHDAPNVLRRLTAVEHRWGAHVRSSSHVHLEGGSCMQLIGLVGKREEVVNAAEDLRGVKGIAFGRYSLGTPVVAGGTTGHRHPHHARGTTSRSKT